MGERHRVSMGLVEEGLPSGCPWEGSPILGCWAMFPPGLPSLPAASRDKSPRVPGPTQLDLSLGQL